MKTINKNIIAALLVFSSFSLVMPVNSQEVKMSRQERKEARMAALNANFSILDSLFTARKFVIVADYLQDQYGNLLQVPPTLNFIKVNSATGILQTGWYNGMGYNGLGGVTTEGNIQSWKIFKDNKKLSYNVRFSLNSTLGFYDVSMNVTADNNVWADITGLRPGRLIYKGHLETIDNSGVFKGTTTL